MNDTLKNILLVAVSFLILMVIVFGSGWFLQAARAQSSGRSGLLIDGSTARSLTVAGRGVAQAQPDQAVIRLGVQTENGDAAAALTENSQQMEALLGALQAAGVAAQDIQTQHVALYPIHQSSSGAAQPVSYRAVNTVRVLARQPEDVPELLNAAVEAGGNTVEEVRYEVSDPSAALEEARRMAVEAARREAEHLAALADAELGEMVRIEEVSQEPQSYPQGGAGGAVGAEQAPILPGSSQFEVTIRVTWLMAPDETPNDEAEPGSTNSPQSLSPLLGW